MKKTEELLQQSLTQYQAILEYVKSIAGVFAQSQGAREMEAWSASLRSMLARAQQTDETINELLKTDGVDVANNFLFLKRLELMAEVARQNKLLFSQITGKLAIISTEIAKVRAGRTALPSYKTGRRKTGRIINSSH
jgi:hypothetical protein